MSQQLRPVALTIAGSDSGGGAGVQIDIRTMARLGVHSTTAITALTAQNLGGVAQVHGVPPDLVEAQIDAVLGGFAVRAVKTGMLWSAAIVESVAARLRGSGLPIVVDPVFVATTGQRLLQVEAVASYRQHLIPTATLLTPNLDEAAALLDVERIDGSTLADAARALQQRYRCAVLLKGGHSAGDPIDTLCTGTELHAWTQRRLAEVNTHGSGCMLAAAITAQLARGKALVEACAISIDFVHRALEKPHWLDSRTSIAGVESVAVPQ